MPHFARWYKIVVAGAGGVGKTCFTIQFIQNHFVDEYDPTIEDSYIKQFLVDDQHVVFDVLDTAGQEEYSAMREQYMRSCEGMIIMYSITNRESFEDVSTLQQQLLRVKDRDRFPMMLIGNKADLERERDVSIMEGMDLAKSFGCKFFESSAKSNINVYTAFHDMVREIQRYHKEREGSGDMPPEPTEIPSITATSKENKSLLSSISRFFRPTKPAWNIDTAAEIVRQQSLNRMLISCVKNNDKKRVKKLLATGADPNAQPGVEGNALHVACSVGHVDMVAMLLKGGAAINAREPRGVTALHFAAREGHIEVVKLLLQRKASLDSKCALYGTALNAAASRGHVKVVRALLKKGADVTAQGGAYGSALHAAAMIGNPEVTALLHDHGVEIDGRGVHDCTALQLSAFAGRYDVVRLLLERGASVNTEGGKYGPAIKAAHDRGHSDIVQLLMKYEASTACLRGSRPSIPSAAEQNGPKIPALSSEKFASTSQVHALEEQNSRRHIPTNLQPEGPEVRQSQSAPDVATQYRISRNFSTPTRSPLAPLRRSPAASDLFEVGDLPTGHVHYDREDDIPFHTVKELGRGTYGVVHEVSYKAEGQGRVTFARKTLEHGGSLQGYRIIQDEIDLLKRLSHVHVVKLLATYSFQQKYTIIMSPVAETNLRDYLQNVAPGNTGSRARMLRWFGCLSAGLAYIHSQEIRHRDIKPANILVKSDEILFTDFGIAKDFSEDRTTTSIGTVNTKSAMYCAPEVAAEKPRGRPSDVFSLGCVFLELATVLMAPYTHVSLAMLHFSSIKVNGVKEYQGALANVLRFILTMCEAMHSFSSASPTDWYKYMIEWCFAMMHPNPQSRISAPGLFRLIQDIDGACTPPTTYVGQCCKDTAPVARKSEHRLFQIWPSDTFYPLSTWSDFARKAHYKLPENAEDDGED